LARYRSQVQQLENEYKRQTQHIEECYDYIELQNHLACKNDAKIKKLTKAINTAKGGDSRTLSIQKSIWGAVLILSLLLNTFFILN
jgi:hypothetical protein